MKYFLWLLKAAIFFTLFAFALNNQQIVSVNFFFGTMWKAPLVLVVLVTFSTGVILGMLLMMPRWWKKHKSKSPPDTSFAMPVSSPGDIKPNLTAAGQSDISRHGL